MKLQICMPVYLLFAAMAFSQDAKFLSFEPAETIRGGVVKVLGENLKDQKVQIALKRSDVAPSQTGLLSQKSANVCPQDPPVFTISPADNSSFAFPIDGTICLGTYSVTVSIVEQPGSEAMLAGTLHVIPKNLKITAVHPFVSYPSANEKSTFDLVLIGEGFSHRNEENALVFENLPSPVVCAEKQDPNTCTPGFSSFVSDNGRELHFMGLSTKKFRGTVKVQVRVGDQTTPQALNVTISRVAKSTPLILSLVFLILLFLMIYGILHSGSQPLRIGKQKYFVSALFLDRETNTYSLSKLQFYLWTSAAIMGYAYLTTVRSLIQGNFEFADIPAGLPGILLASAGTSVLALGISSSKGQKGAGDINPSLSDFITTGGVIAVDRLQFLVWTIVGVFSFLLLMFLRDPGTIEDLPRIPDGFLELMGISAVGYLGAKLVRKPGPRIERIAAEKGLKQLTIFGAGLSQFATFVIDGKPVDKETIAGAEHLPSIVTVDETGNITGLARTLEMKIEVLNQDWFSEKEHLFTILNPDGQKAVQKYQVV
jgi:hypothetical protein